VVASELRCNLAESWAAVVFVGAGGNRSDVLVFEEESGSSRSAPSESFSE
jgi:hypothetical protein